MGKGMNIRVAGEKLFFTVKDIYISPITGSLGYSILVSETGIN